MEKLRMVLRIALFVVVGWNISSASSYGIDQEAREWDLPRFREAPAFKNGKECSSSSSSRSGVVGKDETSSEEVVLEEPNICDERLIHISMTLEKGYIRGTMAAILSIVQHADCPENIAFHFLTSGLESELETTVRAAFPYLLFKVYAFDAGLVKDRISPSIRHALEHPLNYARTYIPDTLPECVRRVIYLDSDVLVFDDIAELWSTDLHGHALAAPEYCHVDITAYFTPTFWSDSALRSVFNGRNPCYFNTGVMIMDLQAWRVNGYARLIEMWMELQKERRIYELGSLPPFLLLFGGNVEPVAYRWNQHGLGGDNLNGICRPLHPGPASLLHWSGKGKPWDRLDAHEPCPLDSLWAPYDLIISSHSYSYSLP